MRFHLGGGIYLIILNPSFHQYWPNTARILQRRKLVQGPRTLLDNVNDLWASFSPLGSFINRLNPLVWTYTFSPPPTPPREFFSKAAFPMRRAWKPPLLCLCMCLAGEGERVGRFWLTHDASRSVCLSNNYFPRVTQWKRAAWCLFPGASSSRNLVEWRERKGWEWRRLKEDKRRRCLTRNLFQKPCRHCGPFLSVVL